MYRHFRSKRVVISLGIIIIVIVVTVSIFFKSRPMFEATDDPLISSLHIEMNRDGVTSRLDIPENEISDELSDNLISIFLNTEIRNRLVPPPQTYHISEESTHIIIWVLLKNRSVRVYLCNKPEYNSVQCGDTHYRIINDQKVYEDVYRLLSDEKLLSS